MASAFLDTNVLVYAMLQADARSNRARDLLAHSGLISVQVLNEFTHVAHRKLRRPWADVSEALAMLRVLFPSPLPLTVDTHNMAVTLAERTGYTIYDALIIASALEGGCDVLYSEDLQDGQVIEGRLRIVNPF